MLNRGDLVNKKGLSPVIASVLLIMLVLVLAMIIFLWARGFISEQIEKFGQPVEQQCGQMDYNIELLGSPGAYTIEGVNHGNVPIAYFDIKKVKGGSSEIKSFKFLQLGVDGTLPNVGFDIGEMSDGSFPEKIIIYPVLLGNVKGKDSSKPFTCVEQGKTITL